MKPVVASTAPQGSPGSRARGRREAQSKHSRRGHAETPRARLRGGDTFAGSKPTAPGHAGRRALHLWSRGIQRALRISLAVMLVVQQIMWPASTAFAEAETITFSRESAGYFDPHPMTFQASNGNIAYCLNFEKSAPAKGQSYTFEHYATGALGYIALHGYNNTTYIEGEELTRAEAQGATQFAYWIIQGSLDREGTQLVRAEGHDPGYTPHLRPRSEKAWQAALRLVDAAKAFEADPTRNTPDALENTSSRIYKQSDGGEKSQEMLSVTAFSGNVILSKDSTDSRTISSQDDATSPYSLKGALYRVWHDKNCTINTNCYIETDAYGKGTLYKSEYASTFPTSLPLGTYYIRESRAPKGYELDTGVYRIEIKSDQVTSVTTSGEAIHERPSLHSLNLRKTSDAPAITDGNPLYSLEGAVYGVWNSREAAENLEDTELPDDPLALDGRWFLMQPMANDAYALDANTDSDAITLEHFSAKDEQKWYASKNEDGTYSLKNGATNTYLAFDSERGEATSSTNASDSHWTITHKSGDAFSLSLGATPTLAPESTSVEPGAKAQMGVAENRWRGQWHLRQVSPFQGRITTDSSGTGTLKNLPDGTYYVRELQAPQGFSPRSNIYTVKLAGGDVQLQVSDTPLVANADALAVKLASGTQDNPVYLPGAEFRVNYYAGSYETLDALPSEPTRSWNVTTNSNGVAGLTTAQDSSGNPLATGDDFYLDSRGTAVLPLGTVTVQETRAPEGFVLTDPQAHLQLITQTDDTQDSRYTVNLAPVQIEDDRDRNNITLATTFTNQPTDSHVVNQGDEVSLVDTVTYTGLNPGQSYELKAVLVDKSTGKPLTIDGNIITGGSTFTPSSDSGTVEVPFELDASKLVGKTIVACEHLYQGDEELAAHADLDDASQTILFSAPTPSFPRKSLKTSARDTLTEEAQATGSRDDTLEDSVSYTGLTPGENYTLTTTLHVKSSNGKDLGIVRDAQGNALSASQEFTPSETSGTITSTLKLDTSPYAGQDLVFFEELSQDGAVAAKHTNISDEAQTIHVPYISTHAHNENGTANVAATQDTRFVDEVSYTNLLPGKEYTLKGTLVNRETHEAITQNERPVTSNVTFIPTQSSGTQSVAFEVDTSQLAGNSIVVFENLALNGCEVARHEDLNDENQTVEVEPPTPSKAPQQTPEKPASVKAPTKAPLPSTGDPRRDMVAVAAIVGAVCLVMGKLEFPHQHRGRHH